MTTDPTRTDGAAKKSYSEYELMKAAKNWLEYHYSDLKKSEPSKFYAMYGLFIDFVTDEFISQ